jgi:YgiT-type zinc finger domain-containing protein
VDNNRDNPAEVTIKAGTLMCPVCCVKYAEIKVDFEYEGSILHNVKMLQCPVCHEEILNLEQHEAIKTRIIQIQK